ncbi:MAG TPA: SBBP repeat-containing protein [Bryobacteraceae bacterium]|nr:SBBP repeat-containing protein [Bryobacteraceae bacterium]
MDRGRRKGRISKTAVRFFSAVLLIASCAQSAPIFSVLEGGTGQEYATSVVSDAQGNTYVAGLTYSADFPVTPGAAQTKFGQTSDAFIAKLGPDGRRIWATYLGGILDDWATGIALDSAGNVWVAGYTRSANFPLVNPIQKTMDNGIGDDFDAFVAKISADGSKVLYSTFLGGAMDDGAAGIAVDSAGNAYVVTSTNSAAGYPGDPSAPDRFGIVVTKLNPQGAVVYSFFHSGGTAGGIALDASGSVYVTGSCSTFVPCGITKTYGPNGAAQAIAFKLSPDGSERIYETALGGSVQAGGTAIAVNSAGEAYIGGVTSSADFPLVHPLQSSSGARPMWKSANSGATWTPLDDLPFALPEVLVPDPSTPSTLYEGTGDLGVFKSVDGGATWVQANGGINGTNIGSLAIDPEHPQTLYAVLTAPHASSSQIYKTTDGAKSWTLIDASAPTNLQLAVDAQSPNIVWEISATLRKSTDGGATWNSVSFPGFVQSMVLDPRSSGHLFAVSQDMFCGFMCGTNQNPFLYRSVDGGAHWIQVSSVGFPQNTIVVDPSTNPSTIYNGLTDRSTDGGVTWSAINAPAANLSAMAVDADGVLYAAFFNGNYVSHDHAQTWTPTGSFLPHGIYPAGSTSIATLVAAGAGGTVYASTNQVATSGFVTKLSADGSSIVFSTYLRGHASMQPFVTYAAEPGSVYNQSGVSAIALDAAGNAVVAGQTRAADFPLVKPWQSASAGLSDAFVASIAPDGSKLNFSTYFGGTQDDSALALALDPAGDVIFAGQTYSIDLPLSIPLQHPCCYGDAFVAKLAQPGPPRITSVENGASNEPGIEAGSWVAIKGTNLANTFPGRTWTSDEIINGELPRSLDGVHVTINGKAAFVYYISPGQINVQAPSDSATGAVNVAVSNNGALGVGSAQLQAFAPGLFTYLGTSYAIASRLPDYTLLGDPSVVAGTVAAKPGDTIALWGTGFGATKPTVPAGVAVSGAPAVVTQPTVTVGGVPAHVISAILSEGSAGLYRITIQLPATLPTGALSVTASVGGVESQAGVVVFLGK